MFDLSVLVTFTLACIAIIVVPGPSVTVIIANSLKSGTRAGLANVAGTQAGIAIMIFILAIGLDTIVENLAHVFTYLKLAGAAYLIWLGIKLWLSDGSLGEIEDVKPLKSLRRYFWQGFIAILSNPKALFFFGAFIPQFVNPAYDTVTQTLVLGLIFMGTATVFDGLYAIAAGKTGGLLNRSNIRLVERISGTCLIGGGLWLAFSKKA